MPVIEFYWNKSIQVLIAYSLGAAYVMVYLHYYTLLWLYWSNTILYSIP